MGARIRCRACGAGLGGTTRLIRGGDMLILGSTAVAPATARAVALPAAAGKWRLLVSGAAAVATRTSCRCCCSGLPNLRGVPRTGLEAMRTGRGAQDSGAPLGGTAAELRPSTVAPPALGSVVIRCRMGRNFDSGLSDLTHGIAALKPAAAGLPTRIQ